MRSRSLRGWTRSTLAASACSLVGISTAVPDASAQATGPWEVTEVQLADRGDVSFLTTHGMIDTNVHFQDVVRLTQRLIELLRADPARPLLTPGRAGERDGAEPRRPPRGPPPRSPPPRRAPPPDHSENPGLQNRKY
jgi:hypothetical protein